MDDFEIFCEQKLFRMKLFEMFKNINFCKKAKKSRNSREFLIAKVSDPKVLSQNEKTQENMNEA